MATKHTLVCSLLKNNLLHIIKNLYLCKKNMTKLFSQRYGYTSLADVIIREDMPESIQNAICNCYDKLPDASIPDPDVEGYVGVKNALTEYLWCNFLNYRAEDLYEKFRYGEIIDVFIDTLFDNEFPWYSKLDMIEMSLSYLFDVYKNNYFRFKESPFDFEKNLNKEFARLNYAYRIVDHYIVEITSEEEIKAVKEAIDTNNDIVRVHLTSALKLMSKRPNGEYRSSIKESISAVENWCRQYTGVDTLGKALNKLKGKNDVIHPKLRTALEHLYIYTNQEDTGIRHALMVEDRNYTPSMDEAVFMIVACSAFINYLNKKNTQI